MSGSERANEGEEGSSNAPMPSLDSRSWWRRWGFFDSTRVFWTWSEGVCVPEALQNGDAALACRAARDQIAKGWRPDIGVIGYRRHDWEGKRVASLPLSTIGHWLQAAEGQPVARMSRQEALLALAKEISGSGARLDYSLKKAGLAKVGGVSLHMGDGSCATLLMHALGWETGYPCEPWVIKRILEMGASPDALSGDGLPPLWLCALSPDKEAGRLAGAELLNAGADPWIEPRPTPGVWSSMWAWRALHPWVASGRGLLACACECNPGLAAELEARILRSEPTAASQDFPIKGARRL